MEDFPGVRSNALIPIENELKRIVEILKITARINTQKIDFIIARLLNELDDI
jgi:hypothetical protein